MNVEISLDEHLLAELQKAGQSLGLDLTQITTVALQAWLKQREGRQFEQEWIAALTNNPDEAGRAEDWLEAQAWSES